MPANIDYTLYFNVAFFSALGLGMLFGFLKGLKKSIWSFFVNLIFIVVFFFTATQVVNILWTLNMPFLGGILASVSPDLADVSKLEEALPILLNQYLGDTLGAAVTNAHLLEFLTSLSLFVLKLVYTILYFTVVQLIYRIIFWIVRLIVLPNNKKTEKYRSKNRGLGALFGLMSGAMSLYVTLILFGGLMSISASLIAVIPNPDSETSAGFTELNARIPNATDSLIEVTPNSLLDDASIRQSYDSITEMVSAYNDNIIVQAQSKITMTSEYTGSETDLSLYLFDDILSMDYQNEQIAFREELEIYSQAAGHILDSGFLDTMSLNDITGNMVRDTLTDLSKSNLLTTIIPLGIEVGSDMYETDLTIPVAELYDIDWEGELTQLGQIAAIGFDIINATGVLNDNTDLTTIDLKDNAEDVEQLFIELGQSDLVNLAAYVALEPVLEGVGEEINAFITIPDDVSWPDEFVAIGAIANEVLSTGITIGDIESDDPTVLITTLSSIDFTTLLNSEIIKNAMINILSGQTTVPIDFLTIPSDINWDTELENILTAINVLSGEASTFDFTDLENIDFTTIANLDLDSINALFESEILVATITDYLSTLDLGGDFPIIIPDSAFDDETGYLKKTELQNVVSAASMIITELACAPDDNTCDDLGFDITGMLSLSSDNIDTLLLSDILSATVGNLVIDMAGDVLTVPGSALTEITVDGVGQDVVSKAEIKAAFLAISALGITDIDNIQVDASILTNLATEANATVLDQDKADLLFGSNILNATITTFLLDYTEGDDAFVVFPYKDQDGTPIRVLDTDGVTELISETELTHVLEAILALDIQDFNNFDSLDMSEILDNVSILLGSSILHATISEQLLDLTDVVVVPNSVKMTSGDVGKETTFIDKDELEAAFDALDVLGITDINNVTIDVSILNNLGTEADSTVLDTAKSDVLFGSDIINATLSKYLFDFTEGADSFVIVPYYDELNNPVRIMDGTTEIISETELTNILEAILALDIQDFNEIESLDMSLILDNISKLLDSSIMHATISKQLLDLTDVVVVPDSVKITTGGVGEETTFITKTELQNTFNSLDVLGMTDINNVTMDVSILNNLGTEADSTILDIAKSDVLFSSVIINATLSKYIIDFTNDANSFIIVPEHAADNTVIKSTATDGTEFISETELTNILKAILALNLQDFDSVETLSLSVIIDNVNVLLDSSIMHASISKQLLDLGSDVIVIPAYYENNAPLQITKDSVVFIDRTELQNTFDALTVLGITDINNVNVDITILDNLGTEADATVLDPTKSATLFSSTIIKATLSKYLIDFGDGASALLQVPTRDENNSSIRNVTTDGINIIAESELNNVLSAILALELDDFNNVDTLNLQKIIDEKATILSSSIFQATISKQFFDLGAAIVEVPYRMEDDLTDIRITVSDLGIETTYIKASELDALFGSLSVLGITDINSFGGDIDFGSIISDSAKVDTLLQSSIIQATISKQIIDLQDTGGDSLLVVPFKEEDNLTDVRVTTGDAGKQTEYIKVTELKNLFDSLNILGLGNVEDFGGTINLTVLDTPQKIQTLTDSTIIQATISKQVFDMAGDVGAATAVIVPYLADDGTTLLRKEIGPLGSEKEIIIQTELVNLIQAFLALGFGNVDDMSGAISLSNIADNSAVVFSSYIIQATVSKQVIDLEGTIYIPYLEDDNSTWVRKVVNSTVNTEYISKSELNALVQGLKLLNAGSGNDDISSFNGSIDLSLFYDAGDRGVLLSSSIFQATITDQLTNISEVVIPLKDDQNTDSVLLSVGTGATQSNYISIDELNKLFESLEILGFSDVNDMSGALALDDLFPSNNVNYDITQDTFLASRIMQATISQKISDLSSSIRIPTEDQDNIQIKVTTLSGDFYVYKDEIKHLFNALDILGAGDLGNFSASDVSLTSLFATNNPTGYDSNQDTMLASAIMQATITDKINDISGNTSNDTIIVPLKDVSDSFIKITTTNYSDFYIDKNEIKNLLNALDILGFHGSDINSFGGVSDFSVLGNASNQTVILLSATMHATISAKLLAVDDNVLIVPFHNQNSETNPDLIRLTISGTEFIVKTEVKAILTALDDMGVTDFTATTLDSSKFFQNPDLYLQSVSIQATISKRLFDANNPTTVIIYPDYDIRPVTQLQIVISQTDVTYIELNELKAMLAALDELGLTNFSNISIDASSILGKDYDLIFTSAIMQATVSNNVLDGADSPGSALNVPDYFREDITVESLAAKWVEKTELINLLEALDILDIDFTGSVSGNVFAGKTPAEIDSVLESGSMYVTFSDMIKSNSNLDIPNIAYYEDDATHTLYGETGVIKKVEVKNFIIATQYLGGDLTAGFTLDDLKTLPKSSRDIIINSIIMRATITQDLTTAMATNGTAYGAADYESNTDIPVLTYAAAQSGLDTLS